MAQSFLRLLLFAAITVASTTCTRAEPTRPAADVSSSDIVSRINQHVERAWQDAKITPSPAASDGEWLRRLFLDVVGRVPTVAEVDRLAGSGGNWRETAADALLGTEYVDEFTRYWTTVWMNELIGRTGGTEPRAATSRDGMASYLRTAMLENRPYDVMARELITATGGAVPEQENFNGAVNFLIEKLEDDAAQATSRTARIFLGMAVECTQCHNHPFNQQRQNQFWELNAFFRQTRVNVTREEESARRLTAELVDANFGGDGRRVLFDDRAEIFLEERDGQLVDRDAVRIRAAPIYFELRNGQTQVAYPVFIDGTSLEESYADRGEQFGNSGALEDVNRRQELADMVVASREFDRAIVNRMWAHFLGYGFTKPIDDIGPHNPPSHSELLDELGQTIRAAGFDLKQLMRWIVLSKPYSLSSRFGRRNESDDPALGGPLWFSRFYVRQMQPEQLYESLLVVTEADATVDQQSQAAARDRWLRQFSTAFGTDEGGEASIFNGSIPQALVMMNGELVRRACRTGNGSFLDRVASDTGLSNREKFRYLYRAALGRVPTKEESRVCNQLLAARNGNVSATLQDVWWALLNSNEFILVH